MDSWNGGHQHHQWTTTQAAAANAHHQNGYDLFLRLPLDRDQLLLKNV